MAVSSINFGKPKIFIRSANGEQEDWTEIVTINTKTDLSPEVADEFVPEWAKFLSNPVKLSFSCTVRWKSKWTRIRLLQGAGFLTRPKCMYRTIKRFSAKRNRY